MNFADPQWAPLYESLLWIVFVAALVFALWDKLGALLVALRTRIEEGASFSVGPSGLALGAKPPANLRTDQPGMATAEGAGGTASTQDVEDRLANRDYPETVQEDVYLIHAAQVIRQRTERQTGLFRVRVWLETERDADLKRCTRVTYRLHDTFSTQVISTEARDKEFELWLTVYGEFTIVAYVEREPGPPIWLTRYLELPGRPPD